MKNSQTLKWLYKNSKQIIPIMILLIVTGILISFVGVRFAMASKAVLDVATGEVQGKLWEKIIRLAILVLVQLFLTVLYSMVDVRVSGKLKINLKKTLFSNLLKKDWQTVSSFHTGELSNRLHNDVNIILAGIMDIIPSVFALLARVILSFFALYSLDRPFALICLAVGPFIAITTRFYSKRMKVLHKKCQETDGKVRSFMQESLQNLIVIKSFRNEDAITNRSTALQDDNYRLSLKRNNISIFANILFYIAMNAATYIALSYCAVKIARGTMAFGTLTAIMQLVGQIQTPFRSLSGFIPKYYATLASAERIMELENIPDETETDSCSYDEMKSIVIENMSFSYDNEEVFHNSNAVIDKGEFIAISGRSGIGKSTLIKLILGIISPTAGSIHIELNDNSNVPAGKSTRNLFAYVPQGNMILSGSIRENIAFSTEDIDDEKIEKSAKIAEIWDFISTLPEGMNTTLGENGLGLSEGQTQRVAIARAIYHDAPIILLDEATSALDEATEKAVIENIKNLKTKTCIFISHRPAVFDICSGKLNITNGVITRD